MYRSLYLSHLNFRLLLHDRTISRNARQDSLAKLSFPGIIEYLVHDNNIASPVLYSTRNCCTNALQSYRPVTFCLIGELRHNKGFPLALYSYGVPETPEKFFTPTEVKKVPKMATPFLPVFSALTKNSNFALDWSRNVNEGTKMCRMSSRIDWYQAEVVISSGSRDNWIIRYAHNRF